MKEHWLVCDDAIIHCDDGEAAKQCAQNRAKAKPGRESYVAFVMGSVKIVELPEPEPELTTTH